MASGGDALTPAEDPIAALCRPDAFPVPAGPVSVIETHLSWVFLAGEYAYKLKKAVRLNGVDLTTPPLRWRNCLEEVRLNRRLAPQVYIGVVPVAYGPAGRLQVGGTGEPVDWVVQMRRLPAEASLEATVRAGRAIEQEAAIRRAARHLARFYQHARRILISADTYLVRLQDGVRHDRSVLLDPRYALPRARVEAVATRQLRLLDLCAGLFRQRVEAGRIVEGHGDLRPEHVWLLDPPAVIDCLEFDEGLRTLDAVDDLAFLSLECERLGVPLVGQWFLDAYRQETGDRPPVAVLGFHRAFRACRRATLAARHLDDQTVLEPRPHLERAHRYLDLAAAAVEGSTPPG